MEFWIGWFHEQSLGRDVAEIARVIEATGFEGVGLSDHIAIPKAHESLHPIIRTGLDPLVPHVEPFTTAAYMGAVTERLRFMTYALVSGMRDPFSIAKQSAVLSDLTNGRFDLGITPGWLEEEIALLGHDPATRGKRFRETLDVIDGLWENDLFSYEGDFYRFEDVGVSPRPIVKPKIYVGGHGNLSLRRAARRDGWIGMIHGADKLEEMIAYYESQGPRSKRKLYIIAGEPLSAEYISRMEDLGVDGMVVMAWPIHSPEFISASARIEALEKFSEKWIV